jgi:6-phosphogluconolactonase
VELAPRVDWSRVHVFWGDERCVPPDHPDSNYRMAREALLDRVLLPEANVHRIEGELGPEEAAVAYERTLRAFFVEHSGEGGGAAAPRFDLILLGMGKDGHTASLFPGHPVLEETKRWVAAVAVPAIAPALPRVTLTLPVLNVAGGVTFVVAGREKREVLRAVLDNPETARDLYPAAMIQPRGRLTWLLDEAAHPSAGAEA